MGSKPKQTGTRTKQEGVTYNHVDSLESVRMAQGWGTRQAPGRHEEVAGLQGRKERRDGASWVASAASKWNYKNVKRTGRQREGLPMLEAGHWRTYQVHRPVTVLCTDQALPSEDQTISRHTVAVLKYHQSLLTQSENLAGVEQHFISSCIHRFWKISHHLRSFSSSQMHLILQHMSIKA